MRRTRRECDANQAPLVYLRRATVHSRNLALAAFFLLLVPVWAGVLKTLAVALVAFLAGLLMATRDVITSILGSLVIVIGKAFRIGDRVSVANLYGDVGDHRLLRSTLLEIGSGGKYTGRFISLPNNLVLNHAVYNESQGEWLFGTIEFALTRRDDALAAKELLLSIAHEICEPYQHDAAKALGSSERWFEPPDMRPSISLSLADPDKCLLILRMPVRQGDRYAVEQTLIRTFNQQYPLRSLF